MNVHNLLKYGPIVAGDADLGVLVTVNGAYLNLWSGRAEDWEAVDARDVQSRTGGRDLRAVTVDEAVDLAEAWVKELRDELAVA